MSASGTGETEARRPRRSWLYLLPIGVFLALGVLFAVALRQGDPSNLPSALTGKPAPDFQLTTIPMIRAAGGGEVPTLRPDDLRRGTVSVVNFWASWCAPCIIEHPLLRRVKAETGAAVYGINYKDSETGARAFLTRLGNVYDAVGADYAGAAGIQWGVTKVPETFVVDGKGVVRFKLTGPIDEQNLATKLIPAIEAARNSR